MTEFLVENPPTEEQFLEAVDNAVAARGVDYVYPSTDCTYNETPQEYAADRPRCLYGQAMFDLGYPVPNDLEGKSIDVVLYNMFGWDMFGPVARAALAGQENQDARKTWGFARDVMWGVYNRRTQ